jgi:hypothetical protein
MKHIEVIEPVIPPVGNFRKRGPAGPENKPVMRRQRKHKLTKSLPPHERKWTLNQFNWFLSGRGMR